MNGPEKTTPEYVGELTALLDRFSELVDRENTAIEHHDTATLQRLAPAKIEAGRAFEALWREFQPSLRHADLEHRAAFSELAARAESLRPRVARNLTLLNAAKVTTANRIEAGIAAWRRSQNEKPVNYEDNGRTSAPGRGSIRPPRLI